jgi:hypothetical protein
VQFDFLTPGEAASSEVVQYAETLPAMASFQTNEYLGGSGAGCSEPITSTIPCTDATFLTILQTGIYPNGQSDPLRAQYIEVFHDNAAVFPVDILTAHGELLPPGISKVATPKGKAPSSPRIPGWKSKARAFRSPAIRVSGRLRISPAISSSHRPEPDCDAQGSAGWHQQRYLPKTTLRCWPF